MLLENLTLRSHIAKSAEQMVCEKYEWKSIAENMYKVFNEP